MTIRRGCVKNYSKLHGTVDPVAVFNPKTMVSYTKTLRKFPLDETSIKCDKNLNKLLKYFQGPGHAMAIPSLPPLAEESVTVQNKDEHKSIADVFPSVQVCFTIKNNDRVGQQS